MTTDTCTPMPTDRHGDWIQTFTGRQFWPLDPRPDDVCIEDIAHALSNLCRYGGHSMRFYSVAEHSVLLSRVVPPEHALAALLHDASEAYVADVPRPLKAFLPGYKAIEARVQESILAAFSLSPGSFHAIKDADTRILSDERTQIMGPPPAPWLTAQTPFGLTLPCWSPEVARSQFLHRFDKLQADAQNEASDD